MKIGIKWRHELATQSPTTVKELDGLISSVTAWSNSQHGDDGEHKDVTAESITINARDVALDVRTGHAGLNASVGFGATADPTPLDADQHNYSPPGIDGVFLLHLDPQGADRTITGFQDGPRRSPRQGRLLAVTNISGVYNIVLEHESASSTDIYRMFLPNATNVTIPPYSTATLYYDLRFTRWIRLGGF
jgi:hypothetical protein